MDTNLKNSYDVIIAGAGPAGSSAAIRLAKAGMSILLIEQKRFPREKLCGEFISPECLIHFQELGVSPAILAAGGTSLYDTDFYSRSGKAVSVRTEWFGKGESPAIGLSRAEMDNLMVEQAKRIGVDVFDETSVTGLLMENAHVRGVKVKNKMGLETQIESSLTVDATGRTRSLARKLEARDAKRSAAKYVAFKTHFRGAQIKLGSCEIYVYRGGYGGCNQVEDSLFNLCFIASAEDTKRLDSSAERIMRELVFTNKRAKYAMEGAVVEKPWLAVPIERFGRGDLVPAKGLITVGDSSAFIDPFTGSGILLALESSKIVANAIVNSRSIGLDLKMIEDSYRKNYAAAFDSRLRVCSWLRYAAFAPWLADATIALLSVNSGLLRHVARATRVNPDPVIK
ncbi:MAG: NAD(P)/FAD-dependent oxidoreductase [Pyrinomonadaceae bacterium]|nr:NAD(P)/FAD-dependent oxidoreductase [Pyrinomonadaceae bacterium]